MKKPNVVVILCDQLRAFEVGCYGNRVVKTPNLDRLAAGGVRFDRAVTNNPVCTPARSSLITGQYSRTCTGEVGNVADDPPCRVRRRLVDPTLADSFRAAGYRTALIGKWHIDPAPDIVGFDYACHPLTIHRYVGQTFVENGKFTEPVTGFSPEHEIEKVREFVANRGEEPFFLFYNISLPHEPIGKVDLPEKYRTMYRRDELPLRPNVYVDGKPACNERWFKVYTIWDYFWRMAGGPCWNAAPECNYPGQIGELPSDRLPDGFDLRDLTALYYGATSCVDDLVGKLMQILEANGIADDTLVIFTSDHGDNLGSHHYFNKDCLMEESIRIPMIFHSPRHFGHRENLDHLAQIIDIMPTVLDLCGVEIPDSVQGRSLLPLLTGDAMALEDNVAFIETDGFVYGSPVIGIRTPSHVFGLQLTKDWRGIQGDWRMYDLRRDPYEEHNLLAAGEQTDVAERLRRRLLAWHEATPWLAVERR